MILNQINARTTGRCFPPASTAKFLFRIPRMSADKQPSASTGWGCPGCRSHKNARQEKRLRVCPRPGMCRRGKGWERLPPSSPWPFLNIFSADCSAGLPTPNCPLPWGGVSSSCVPSKRCCDTGAEHVPTVWWPLQHPWTLLSSIPTSCHKCIGKRSLSECLPHAINPIRISG